MTFPSDHSPHIVVLVFGFDFWFLWVLPSCDWQTLSSKPKQYEKVCVCFLHMKGAKRTKFCCCFFKNDIYLSIYRYRYRYRYEYMQTVYTWRRRTWNTEDDDPERESALASPKPSEAFVPFKNIEWIEFWAAGFFWLVRNNALKKRTFAAVPLAGWATGSCGLRQHGRL